MKVGEEAWISSW